MGSECAYTNLFIWRDYYRTYWTEHLGFLIIKVDVEDTSFSFSPSGGRRKTCRGSSVI